MTSPLPPAWARSLLELLTSARERESVQGDLLEEYSESVLPERGRAAANRWYARQVWGFWWRASWTPGAALAGNLTGRLLIDIVAPSVQPDARAPITTYLAIGLFALWGFRTGRRTGLTLSGLLVGVLAALVAAATAIVATLAIGAVGAPWIRPNPAAWAALVEGFDVPILPLLVIGGIVSTLAAAVGTRFTASPGSRSSIRT
jgi:hypothetical protein